MNRFEELFATFRTSAWRLEVLDGYNVSSEDKSLREFLRTGRYIAPEDDAEWCATIRAARARGATMGRIRLVGHPVTDYTRWEFAAYRTNIEAGEDIRVIDRRWLDESWDNAPDVWVFDEATALRMLYGPDGSWLGFEEVPAEPFVNVRRVLEPLAVPAGRYRLDDAPAPRRETPPVSLPVALAAA